MEGKDNMLKNSAKIEEYVDLITQKGLFPPKHDLNIYLHYLFDEISFEGKSMLDDKLLCTARSKESFCEKY